MVRLFSAAVGSGPMRSIILCISVHTAVRVGLRTEPFPSGFHPFSGPTKFLLTVLQLVFITFSVPVQLPVSILCERYCIILVPKPVPLCVNIPLEYQNVFQWDEFIQSNAFLSVYAMIFTLHQLHCLWRTLFRL